jgi:hypothetical protein
VFSNTTGSALVFYNLALVSGNFTFSSNAASTAGFPVLTAVVGNFMVSRNHFLTAFQAVALKTIGGVVSIVANNPGLVIAFSPLRVFEAFCDGGSGPESADLQGCTRVRAERWIIGDSSPTVRSSLLTYTGGSLWIRNNDALVSIDLPHMSFVAGALDIFSNAVLPTIGLPSLSVVISWLAIYSNPSLTLLSLPKLTHIGDHIRFCINNAVFTIPSGPPNAPTGGLVVINSQKGNEKCFLQQGAAACGPPVTCP